MQGVNYNKTFSPTARFTSIRMLMQLAVEENLMLHQMDVKAAYLDAPVDCEIYTKQPEGYIKEGEDGKELTCKLN